jgi:hypothetical protein
MRTMWLLFGLLISPLSSPADDAAAPPAGWKEYSPKDRSFSVWLPDRGGRRSERERTMSLRGQRMKINLVRVEPPGGPALTAATAIVPPTMFRGVPLNERIELLRDALVEDVRGKVEGEKAVELGRVPGKEYEIATGRGLIRLRLFALGGRFYEAMVEGSKAQIQGKDADAFLDSYKLPARATDPTAETGKEPDTRPGTKAGGRVATTISGDIYPFIKDAIAEKRVEDVQVTGFKLAKDTYRDLPPQGGILIGFELGLGSFATKPVINAFRPIYLTAKGEHRGEWHGPLPLTQSSSRPGRDMWSAASLSGQAS